METPLASLTASQCIGVFIFLTTLTRAASWRHRYNLVALSQLHCKAAKRRRMVPTWVKNYLRAVWGGVEAVTGRKARQETLVPGRTEWNFTHYTCSSEDTESDTLRQHLQGPQKAAQGALEFYTFTLAPPTPWLMFQHHWFGTNGTKKFDALVAETLLHCSFACIPCILQCSVLA